MRPIRVGKNGEEFFFLFVHPKCARDLMFSADWQNRALSTADVFGKDLDPLATGALGVVDNVIIKRSERIYATATESIARNLLVGADAAILGWAQMLDYREELPDYGTRAGFAAGEIRGGREGGGGGMVGWNMGEGGWSAGGCGHRVGPGTMRGRTAEADAKKPV